MIEQNIMITQRSFDTTAVQQPGEYIQQHNISSYSYCWIGQDNKLTNDIKKFKTTSSNRQNLQFTCPGDITKNNKNGKTTTTTTTTTTNTIQTPTKIRDTTKITLAMSYYGHPGFLLNQLETIYNYPLRIRQQIKIIVVDDGSPKGLEAIHYIGSSKYIKELDIRLARIDVDIPFNMAGAKNLAAYLCETSRLLLMDLDLSIPTQAMQQVLGLETKSVRNETAAAATTSTRKRPQSTVTYYYTLHRFNRLNKDKIHPGVCLFDVDGYFLAGATDEDFSGSYGKEDTDFKYRWSIDGGHRFIENNHHIMFSEAGKGTIDPCGSLDILNNNATLYRQCLDAVDRVEKSTAKPSKDPLPNSMLHGRKKQAGRWSNRFLRFPWHVEF
jgi:hypothetical protein